MRRNDFESAYRGYLRHARRRTPVGMATMEIGASEPRAGAGLACGACLCLSPDRS